MEQFKTLRYKFTSKDDPETIAQNLVNNYNNAIKDNIHFDSIELKIEDKRREYLVMGKIYKLDTTVYNKIDVIY